MSGLCLRGTVWMGARVLLRDLDLAFPAGGWGCLLGPSGVGKSSVARLVAGLEGAARLEGQIRAEDGAPLAGRVALMAQEAQLLPWADLLANVTIGARLRGARPDLARARDLLAQVGLGGMEARRPDALSGGQRQRVALARVLMEECPIVLLDEPFSALDAATRLAMQDLAARLLAGRTVILITHDPLEALRLASRAWLLGPQGAEALPLPGGPIPRDYRAPDLLAAQGALLARLQGLAPCAP
jgi:putative hydroxymethylpyrimidine transport system ATP-binding protein